MAPQQQIEKVSLSLRLRTSPPHAISIHDANPAKPLQLIATIKQTASPCPSRAVTILTKYSCLDTTPSEDAFFHRAMASPRVTPVDTSCPAPELPLRPVARHITFPRESGDPDLTKREEAAGFKLVTIPAVGKGHAEVVFELPPAKLLLWLGNKNEPVEEKLRRLLRVGDTYKIVPSDMGIRWWAFGALDDESPGGLKGKKIARWTFPDRLPLVREPGEDETDEVAHELRDLVDLHDVNYLSSRSAVEGEQRPVVREMRSDRWAFGEPECRLALRMSVGGDEGATFSIKE